MEQIEPDLEDHIKPSEENLDLARSALYKPEAQNRPSAPPPPPVRNDTDHSQGPGEGDNHVKKEDNNGKRVYLSEESGSVRGTKLNTSSALDDFMSAEMMVDDYADTDPILDPPSTEEQPPPSSSHHRHIFPWRGHWNPFEKKKAT